MERKRRTISGWKYKYAYMEINKLKMGFKPRTDFYIHKEG